MRFQMKRKHMIDFLFPIALFFVFALSALAVILFATRTYQDTTEHSALNYTARTSLSYISEKLHQNDADGAIEIGSFDGNDAVIMKQAYENETYYTYIYADGQELKELFVKEGAEVSAASGQTILKVQDFTIRQATDDLIRISCSDEDGNQASAFVSIKSD